MRYECTIAEFGKLFDLLDETNHKYLNRERISKRKYLEEKKS